MKLYTLGDGSVVGRTTPTGADVFTVTVNESTGALNITLLGSLDHPTGSASITLATGALLARAEMTDADGDSSSATVDVATLVRFGDDVPTAGTLGGDTVVSLQESDIAAGAATATVKLSLGAGTREGADAPVSTAYSLEIPVEGVDSGLTTSDGTAVKLYTLGDGSVVGRTTPTGADVFTVTVNESTGALN
ncbi:MAG: DUF5801 repeats-in-toxin domain-containing protein, partial [bacterium]